MNQSVLKPESTEESWYLCRSVGRTRQGGGAGMMPTLERSEGPRS